MADIQRYLDNVESQHKDAPNFMALLTAMLTQLDGGHQVMKDIPAAFNLDDAVGVQLDVDGELVGIDRRHSVTDIAGVSELLDDDSFRMAIKTKIIQNQWDGTGEAFNEIWNAAFGNMVDGSWFDNQDMTIDVDITGQVPYDLIRLIQRGYYLPRPAGVGMMVTITDKDYEGKAKMWANAKAVGMSMELSATAHNSSMEV